MGILAKLQLLFRFRQPATDLITEVSQVKSGYKTVAFWLTVLTTLGSAVAAAQGLIPATVALIASTAITGFYNILRGATKADTVGVKPVLQSSEFWSGVLTQVSNAILALQHGGINPAWFTTAETLLGAAMAAAQNLAAQQPNEPPTPQS